MTRTFREVKYIYIPAAKEVSTVNVLAHPVGLFNVTFLFLTYLDIVNVNIYTPTSLVMAAYYSSVLMCNILTNFLLLYIHILSNFTNLLR